MANTAAVLALYRRSHCLRLVGRFGMRKGIAIRTTVHKFIVHYVVVHLLV